MNSGTRRIRLALVFALVGIVGLAVLGATASTASMRVDFVGRWQGSFELGDYLVRVGLAIRDGGTLASLDGLDPRDDTPPIAAVSVAGDTIHFDVRILNTLLDLAAPAQPPL